MVFFKILDSIFICNYKKFQLKTSLISRYVLILPSVPMVFANCSIGRDENDHRHLLKCVKLYGKFIIIRETLPILRRHIAAILLKILCGNPNSVKSYDKSNMKVFALSLWENFSWGLTYFDQLIYL